MFLKILKYIEKISLIYTKKKDFYLELISKALKLFLKYLDHSVGFLSKRYFFRKLGSGF